MSLHFYFLLQLFASTTASMLIPLFLLPFPILIISLISAFISGLIWCIRLQVNSGPKERLLTFYGQWGFWWWGAGFFSKMFYSLAALLG